MTLHERDFAFEPNGKYVLVGVRHAGKSYLLYQRARQLVAEGHSVEEMCYINFDDERLIGMKADALGDILTAYQSLFDRMPIFFFDEIQNVEGWERFVRRLANEKYQVFITGSNAKMPSREIATTLGERYLMQEVMPYSFSEYLRANGVSLDRNWRYGREAGAVALRRAYGEEVRFYRHNVEVDFCAPRIGIAVQACWSMSDAGTAKREIGALAKLDAHMPLARRVVVTREQRGTVTLKSGRTVEVVPLQDWLLELPATAND